MVRGQGTLILGLVHQRVTGKRCTTIAKARKAEKHSPFSPIGAEKQGLAPKSEKHFSKFGKRK